MKLAWLFISGMLFGIGLAVSGMTDPAKVRGFLDISGLWVGRRWDPTLAFVMAGALSVFGGGMWLLRRGKPRCDLPEADSKPVGKRLVLGAIIFGIGWGLVGFCPGPALANLAVLRTEALVFVPMMALGMALQRLLVGKKRNG